MSAAAARVSGVRSRWAGWTCPGVGKVGAAPVAVGALFTGVSWRKRWRTHHHTNPGVRRFQEKRWEQGLGAVMVWAVLRRWSRGGRSRDAGPEGAGGRRGTWGEDMGSTNQARRRDIPASGERRAQVHGGADVPRAASVSTCRDGPS